MKNKILSVILILIGILELNAALVSIKENFGFWITVGTIILGGFFVIGGISGLKSSRTQKCSNTKTQNSVGKKMNNKKNIKNSNSVSYTSTANKVKPNIDTSVGNGPTKYNYVGMTIEDYNNTIDPSRSCYECAYSGMSQDFYPNYAICWECEKWVCPEKAISCCLFCRK